MKNLFQPELKLSGQVGATKTELRETVAMGRYVAGFLEITPAGFSTGSIERTGNPGLNSFDGGQGSAINSA
jgi:hypothetical protein